MSGWAATNTLRELFERDGYWDDPDYPEVPAALALVEAALDAAERRRHYGHNDTCDLELSESEDYPCSCGHDALAAALRAVREGK